MHSAKSRDSDCKIFHLKMRLGFVSLNELGFRWEMNLLRETRYFYQSKRYRIALMELAFDCASSLISLGHSYLVLALDPYYGSPYASSTNEWGYVINFREYFVVVVS